jgi:methionine-gamma-lyase
MHRVQRLCRQLEPFFVSSAGYQGGTQAVIADPHHPGLAQSLSVPIVLSSTFIMDSTKHGARLSSKSHANAQSADEDGFLYSRWGNPTNQAVGKVVSRLEHAKATFVYASGMSAISATLLTQLGAGTHLICQAVVYGGTLEFLSHYAPKYGIEVTYVPCTDLDGFRNAIRPNTRLIYVETPANPNMRLTDLSKIGEIALAARQQGSKLLVAVDGTFSSPVHQQPLTIAGIDISIHSATKYLGGHSDLLAGVVSTNNLDFITRMGLSYKMFGGGLPPFDSYLLLRGVKTLDVRMERHSKSALTLAMYLEKQPKIATVFYPGLASHPDHQLARRQMSRGYGGMMSFEVKSGEAGGRKLVEHLRLIKHAVSLGGVESLICHSASTTHAMVDPMVRRAGGVTDGLVRFSVGLEHVDDLQHDLEQALLVV